jgi:hypothetical protein
MRHLALVITLIYLASCKDNPKDKAKSQQWTEEQKRKYYTDSFSYSGNNSRMRQDTSISFEKFMAQQYPELKSANKYDPFIYGLEEPYIDTTQVDMAKHWFRITVAPCFRHPYCFILEKKDGQSVLTTKISNGDGGYYPGVLISTMRFYFGDTLYNIIYSQLSTLDFWNLGNDTTCYGGFDGETWTFEAMDKGRYKIIGRWAPQNCGNEKTKQLSEIGIMLGKLSKLDNVLEAIGARKSGLLH